MTAATQIPQALIAAYRASGAFPDNRTAYPNAQFNPPAVSEPWAALWNMPVDNTEFTVNTADEYTGLLQIDLNYPRNTGEGAALSKASQIAATFRRGTRMFTDDGYIQITGCTTSQGFESNGWWKIPVTIQYRGFYRRT